MNIAFGGRIMSDVTTNVEDVLAEVVEELYKPKTPEVLKKLVRVFQLAEDAYCGNMNYDADGVHLKGLTAYPGPGELHIGFGIGLAAGASAVPVYLLEPNLSDKGRAAYAKGLETCLKSVYEIEGQCVDAGRARRLKECILNALDDVAAVAYARETGKQVK